MATTVTRTLDPAQMSALEAQRQQLLQVEGTGAADGKFNFFAAFDGTNNDRNNLALSKDPYQTNVANLYDQAFRAAQSAGISLDANYYPGVGTGGENGGTLNAGPFPTAAIRYAAEQAYADFTRAARDYRDANPNATPADFTASIAAFSRGTATGLEFARLINERGLLAADGSVIAPPGSIKITGGVALMDPVWSYISGENMIPPNVVGPVLVIQALDENRSDFRLVDLTGDPRVHAVWVSGNHVGIGGGYDLNGTSAVALEGLTAYFQQQGTPLAEVPQSHRFDPNTPARIYTEIYQTARNGDIVENEAGQPNLVWRVDSGPRMTTAAAVPADTHWAEDPLSSMAVNGLDLQSDQASRAQSLVEDYLADLTAVQIGQSEVLPSITDLLEAEHLLFDLDLFGALGEGVYEAFSEWTTGQLLSISSPVASPEGWIPGWSFGWIGAFYENRTAAFDTATSIANRTGVLLNGTGALNAAGVASRDTNADGRLSGDELSGLNRWSDLDEDGWLDAGELQTLSQAGINQIQARDYAFFTAGNSRHIATTAAEGSAPSEALPARAGGAIPSSNYRTLRDTDNILYYGVGGVILWSADQIKVNHNNRSYLIGTDGNDSFDARYYAASPQYFDSNLLVNFLAGGGDDVVGGSDRSDSVWGGTGNDQIRGFAGDDRLYGEEGNDTLAGEDGADVLDGGSGSDRLIGGTGDDTLYGGTGADELQGGDGNDRLMGEGDGDRLFGQSGDDLLWGGDGDDVLVGSGDAAQTLIAGVTDNDKLYGGAGNDNLYGELGDDQLLGGTGSDLLVGNDGNDRLWGGAGSDELQGGAGNDRLMGNEGDDRLFGQVGNDLMFGGDGNDLIVGFGGSNEAKQTLGVGESDNDVLFAGAGNDLLVGGLGDDELHGEGGNDELQGGVGRDRLYGGEGADRLFGQVGNDLMYGGDGDDLLVGFTGFNEAQQSLNAGETDNDHLYGGAGSDTLVGGVGNDYLDGGAGADAMEGGAGDDTYIVNSVNDSVLEQANEGRDVVISSVTYLLNSGVEELRLLEGLEIHGTGNALDNTLTGNSENNILDGVTGGDRMVGGAGDDTYYIDNVNDTTEEVAGEGVDTVRATISTTLAAHVENLVLLDFATPERGLADGVPILVFGYPKRNELDYTQGDAVQDFQGTCALTAIANLLTQADRLTSEGQVVRVAIDNRWTVTDPAASPYVRGGSNYLDQQNILTSYGIRNDLLRGYDEQAVGNLIRGGRGVIIAVNAGQLWNDAAYAGNGAANHMVTLTGAAYRESDGALMGFYIADSGRRKVTDMTRYVSLADFRAAARVPEAYAIYTMEPLKLWDEDLNGSGNALDNRLLGNRSDNVLMGEAGTDTLDGLGGNDTLVGGAGSDTYLWSVGGGRDVISERGDLAGTDTLRLAPGIRTADVFVSRRGNDLEIEIGNDCISVQGHFQGRASAIEQVEFADGTRWSAELLQAMADQPLISISPLPAVTVNEDAIWRYELAPASFNGSRSEPLTYRVTRADGSKLPAWLAFDAVTRTFSGTPANSDVGSVDLRVTAHGSNGAYASGAFTLTVANANDAPILVSGIANQTANTSEAFRLVVPAGTFTDIDASDVLRYALRLANGQPLPTWLGFDSATCVISGTPPTGHAGTLALQLVATDTAGASASARFSLNVVAVNHAPMVASALPTATLMEDARWVYQVPATTFTDIDGDTLRYRATLASGAPLPAWLRFDAATQTFTGTPSNAEVGQLAVRLIATDSSGLAATCTLGLQVRNINDAPIVSGFVGVQNVMVAEPFTLVLPANLFTDVDVGDLLTYTVSGPLPQGLTFDGRTRTLAGTPTTTGTLTIQVAARDSFGVTTSTTFGMNIWSRVAGTEGNDTLSAAAAGSALMGLGGDDWLSGGSGADLLSGGAGVDSLRGGAGNDTLDGGAGNDMLYGDSGGDSYLMYRGMGQDVIVENDAVAGVVDTITVAAGIGANDITVARSSSSDLEFRINGTVDKFTVRDWVGSRAKQIERVLFADGTSWQGATLDTLSRGTATEGADVLYGQDMVADSLDGLGGNDTIYGLDGNDLIKGGAGSDILYGGGGDDTLDGGAGADTLRGEAGNDTYLVYRGMGQDTVADSAGTLDAVNVAAGLTATNIQVSRDAYHLYLTIAGTTDKLTLQNWFRASEDSIERVCFTDGTVWTADALRAMCRPVGTEAADNLFGDELLADTVNGLGGNDVLYGNGGDDVLDGGAGADKLYGGAGNDVLDGGPGNDLLFGEAGNDTYRMYRGMGVDTVTDLDASIGNIDAVQVIAGLAPSDITVSRDLNNLYLGIGGTSDKLTLTNWFLDVNQQIEQVRFSDGTRWDVDALRLRMRPIPTEGADTLFGDSVLADTVDGLGGNDTLYGLGGDDTLNGGAGTDRLFGGSGNDTLDGGSGNDELMGESGNDSYAMYRGMGADVVNDYDIATGNVDVVKVGSGIAASDVKVTRDAGSLYLSVSGTTDRLKLSNWFSSGYGIEQVEFTDGARWDWAELRAQYRGVATERGDTLAGDDDVADAFDGLGGDDNLFGYGGNDVLDGGAGVDTLWGGEGNDTLDGGPGNDLLYGGGASDTYLVYRGMGRDEVSDYDNTVGNVDTIRISSDVAVSEVQLSRTLLDLHIAIAGSQDGLTILGWFASPDNVIERIAVGNEVWDAAAIIAKTNTTPTDAANTLFGTFGADALNGLAGNDTINGLDGDDVLMGGRGADTVVGGNGLDTLDGGAGDDWLEGGAGGDTYVLSRGSGADHIYDFDEGVPGTDVFMAGPGITLEQLWFSKVRTSDLEVSVIGTGDKVTIQNWFAGTAGSPQERAYHVEQFRTSDGHMLLDTQVQLLVDAMATFAVPPMGTVTLPANYQTTLVPTLVATWTS